MTEDFPALQAEVEFKRRCAELFAEHEDKVHRRADRIMAWLMSGQWLAGIAAALWFTPTTWLGETSQIHFHVWVSILLGGLITVFPVILALKRPGSVMTRHCIAFGQMLMSSLLIHLTGGRIETHFHIFGSLAILAFYRDWRVLLTAAVVVAGDHFFRGVLWPQSVFGILTGSYWRWLEHAWWVTFECVFLFISMQKSQRDTWTIVSRQAELEGFNQHIERRIERRTAELAASNKSLQREVLERKRIEMERDRIFTLALDPLCLLSFNGCFARVNREFQRIFGYTEAELIGLPCVELIHPDARAGFLTELQGLATGRSMVDFEIKSLAKDKTLLWIEWTATPVLEDKIAYAYGRDVTQRHKAADALRRSEERFRQIAENIKEVFWMTSLDKSQMLYISPAYETIWGRTCQSLVERPISWIEAIHPADRARVLAAAENSQASGGYAETYRVVRPDGQCRWINDRAFGIRNELGVVYRVAGVATDITERKQAEEAIRESEARFRQIAEHIHEVFWMVTADWRQVLYISPAYEQVWGRTCASLYERPESWREAVYAEDLALVRDAVTNDFGSEPQGIKYRILRPDGTMRWIHDRASQIYDDTGTLIRIVGLAEDITERKQAAEALRAREESFRALTENVPDAVARLNRELRFVYVNPALANSVQMPAADLLGKTCSELGLPAHREWDTAIQKVFTTGQNQVLEFVHETPAGTKFLEAHLVPEFRLTGKVDCVLTVTREVTKLRTAIADFKEARERFDLAVRGSNDGIWDWDLRSTRNFFFSTRFKELLGYSEAEFANEFTSWQSHLHEADIDILNGAIWAHLGQRKPLDVEHRLLTKGGEYRWFRTRGQAVWNELGQPVRIAGSVTDINDLKANEAALRHAKDAAEAANRAKSEFLATMSHEIRTPMSGVLGMAQLLLDSSLQGKQQRYAEIIRDSGQSLLTIINDILDFSKIEAGKISIEAIPFPLENLLNDVTGLLRPKAQRKHVEFDSHLAPDMPARFIGDPLRIRQVVLNLADNAIKFTRQGRVRIETECVSQSPTHAQIKFSVSDTGIGIPLDKQAKLFVKFSQADSSTTRQFGGTGLGLAICKQLVKLMGGEIGVASEAGQGATFWFTLPLVIAPDSVNSALTGALNPDVRALAMTPQPAGAAEAPRLRVLLAEDNATNEMLAVALLEKLGCLVAVAHNGMEAEQMVGEGDYDVVFMDCHMPEMDGFDATARIRSREGPGRHISIIAVTADAMVGDREKCLAAGMDDYICKPVEILALQNALQRWGPRHSTVATTVTMAGSERAPADAAFDPNAALNLVGGDRNLLARMVASFCTNAQTLQENIHAGIERRDGKAVFLAAHTLKGSARMFSAAATVAAAFALEEAGKSGDWPKTVLCEETLALALARLLPELEEFTNQNGVTCEY